MSKSTIVINAIDGCAKTLQMHYSKDGLGNIFSKQSSSYTATTAVIEIEDE